MATDILSFVGYGEIFVFIILICSSILALAVGCERTILFQKIANKKTTRFFKELVDHLRKRDIKAAEKIIKNCSENAYTRFTQFAIDHVKDRSDGAADLMSGKIIEEKIILEKRLTILNTLGNNAPFIGLLGTVLGVIKAFHGLGTLGSTGAEVVMRSISQALLATAAGLFIAIPVVMANNYFSRKIKTIIQQLEILLREFSAILHNQKSKF